MTNKKQSKSQFTISPSRRSRLSKRSGRSSVVLYPTLIEKKYEAKVLKLMLDFFDTLRITAIVSLPDLEKEFLATMRADSQDHVRMDEFTDSVNEMTKSILSGFRVKLQAFKNIIEVIGDETNEWNQKQINRVFKDGLGVDILSSDKDLSTSVDIWARDNVKRIADLASDETKRLEQMIVDGYRNGLRHESIAKGIADTLRTSTDRTTTLAKGRSVEDRARLIARDQIGKLNASVTRARQSKLGLKTYIWRTALDERVRETHRALEGEVFAWDSDDGPLPPEGHPGMPINCRCHAEPNLKSFFE